MKVKRFKSFRFKMIMYMFLSLLATIATEGLIFMGIYLYETEIIAGEYKKVWGASGQGKMSLGTFTMSQSVALDAWVIVIFTILLLVIYFILISNKFVMYVREIISGVERMKSGDLMEEIPVQGEDEFSEIAASINEMRQNLYETMESQKAVEKTKDELITNVAHDLRTPLTSILGYLDLLTQGDFLTEEQKQKYLGIVSSKAKQLETLVKDLFDYTRYDKNKVKIKKEILDLNLFVPQLVDEFYPSFMDHKLECRTDFYEGALNIEGNGELLARAIGKIIPAKDLDKIFDKFYRVENSRSLKTGGTGLGLAIAKNIVNLHEGEIWATSDESGTRFQIELPVVQAHAPKAGK